MSPALSRTWAHETHEAFGRTPASDMAVRLALALGPVKAAIRVVNNDVPPLSVDWATDGDARIANGGFASYTDFRTGRIRINPLPITENKLPPEQAIDVVTGFAMHEASHAQHSRNRMEILIETAADGHETARFRPLRIAAYVLNLVEDVRVEGLTSKRWPGFADYFTAVLDYMWAGHKPASYGPDLVSKLSTAFLACRYPDRVVGHLGDPAVFGPEIDWWQAWQRDYLDESATPEATVQAALDHLASDAETKAEMTAMADEEAAAEAAGERIRKMIERLLREGIHGAPTVCVTDSSETKALDVAVADVVHRLVDEGLIEMRPIVTGKGVSNPPLRIQKPIETNRSQTAYVGHPDATAAALRTHLVFRSAAPEHQVKLLDRGTIDDEELWRWAAKDYRVFSDRVVEARPDVLFGLLVDLSGSMQGSGSLIQAQRLAQLFVWAFHDQPGVRTEVWGHTGDTGSGASIDLYRLWEPGDPLTRLGLISTLPHANNFDGHAIAWCVSEMRDEREPQKVLIVLSDGIPSGQGYGDEPAMRHVRQVVEWASKQGVDVVQVAIDRDLRPDDQTKMFGSQWVPFTTAAALPRTLAKLMARFTR